MKTKVLWWTLVLVFASVAMLGNQTEASAQAEPTVSPDEQDEMYWAEQRQIRVLQRRMFEKDGRLELSLYAGVIPNDPFIQYHPMGLRLGYYLQENIGLELSGFYIGEILRHETDVADIVRNRYGGEVDVLDQQLWGANMMGTWTPLYGKFAAGRRIVQFDWNFGAGVGVVGTSSVSADGLTNESTPKPQVLLGTGWTFWLSNHLTARVDVRYLIFEKVGGGVTMPTELSLGFGYFF